MTQKSTAYLVAEVQNIITGKIVEKAESSVAEPFAICNEVIASSINQLCLVFKNHFNSDVDLITELSEIIETKSTKLEAKDKEIFRLKEKITMINRQRAHAEVDAKEWKGKYYKEIKEHNLLYVCNQELTTRYYKSVDYIIDHL